MKTTNLNSVATKKRGTRKIAKESPPTVEIPTIIDNSDGKTSNISFNGYPDFEEALKNFSYKPKYLLKQDLEDYDEEEKDYEDKPSDREKYLPISEKKLHSSINNYLASLDRKYLLEFIMKNHLFSDLNNTMSFRPPEGITETILLSNYSNRINKDVVNTRTDIIYLAGLILTKEEEYKLTEDIYSLIVSLYLCKQSGKTFISINSIDVLFDIIKSCVSKGVYIDSEFKDLKVDFRELRKTQKSLRCFYSKPTNQLILMGEHSDCVRFLSSFYHELDNLPSISLKRISNEESITIDGNTYSKRAFESLIEDDYNNFINNLNVEMYLNIEDKEEVDTTKLELL